MGEFKIAVVAVEAAAVTAVTVLARSAVTVRGPRGGLLRSHLPDLAAGFPAGEITAALDRIVELRDRLRTP